MRGPGAGVRFPSVLLTLAAAVAAGLPAAGWERGAGPRAASPGGELLRLVAAARDRVFPALVHIEVVTVDHFGGKEFKTRTVGSGTIISAAGYVLTNYHVTAGGKRFRCTLSDRQELPAELVGEDPLTDLAVLRLDLAAFDAARGPLPTAGFGSSGELEVGDYVLAMGSPFALSRSVTLGIVSNTERVLSTGVGGPDPDEMQLSEGQRTGLFTRWIQHDALINPGNSGGPLVNLEGEIVGINELGGAAMGFAIPSDLAREVAAALVEKGEVPRSWIGVSFRPLQGTGYDRGVLVNSLVAEGPAARAGLAAGDLVVAIDGEPLTVRFAEEVPLLARRIADLPVGGTVELSYERQGVAGRATVVTERLEKDRGEEEALRSWGLTVEEITEKMARDQRLTDTAGVLVSGVRPGGPGQLAEPPLAPGDVIRAVAGQRVSGFGELLDLYRELSAAEPAAASLLVEFDRNGKSFLTVLEPRADRQVHRPRELPKAWIGVATQPVLPGLAAALDLPGAAGFRVTRVYPGTEALGVLEVGDIIVALDGERLAPRGMQDAGLLTQRLRRLTIGGEAALTVLRAGDSVELSVPLERSRLTPEEARRDRDEDFELVVRELTFFDRDEQRWRPEVGGVLVEAVEPAGWAGLGGLRPGDLLQRIGEGEVADLRSFRRALAAVTAARPERVVMVVLRGVRTQFLYLEPDWGPLSGAAD